MYGTLNWQAKIISWTFKRKRCQIRLASERLSIYKTIKRPFGIKIGLLQQIKFCCWYEP